MSGALTRSAAQGVTWFGITQVLDQGSRMVSTIVLARLLFSEDSGITTMATIVTTLALNHDPDGHQWDQHCLAHKPRNYLLNE